MPRRGSDTADGDADFGARIAGELGEYDGANVFGYAGIEHERRDGIVHESGGDSGECGSADLYDGDFGVCGWIDCADGIACADGDADCADTGEFGQFDEDCNDGVGECAGVWDGVGER